MELFYAHKVGKELDKIPDKIAQKIIIEIQKLGDNPFPPNCKKLTGQDNYRIRIGSYRAIYTIDPKNKRLIILRVAHRKTVYR